MKIRGNTVGTSMPRTDYNQTNPQKADYLKGKEDLDRSIQNAQTAADNAKTAANNAQTAANNAKTAADNAQTAANNAQTAANNAADKALPKAGGTMTGALNVITPTENSHATNKEYVDAKHKEFTATLTVNDWVGDTAPYTQTIGIEGILESDRPHITPAYSDDYEIKKAQREAWNMVCEAESADGSITFTCFDEKPETAVPVEIEVNR